MYVKCKKKKGWCTFHIFQWDSHFKFFFINNEKEADWLEKYFSGQSAGRKSNTSGTGSVGISAQGLFRS